MIGALGKMHEWELHCRGAIQNGVTRDELRAIIHVIAIYCVCRRRWNVSDRPARHLTSRVADIGVPERSRVA